MGGFGLQLEEPHPPQYSSINSDCCWARRVCGRPGTGTVWERTNYSIESTNPVTSRSRAIRSVLHEPNAPSTPLKMIKNSRFVSLKKPLRRTIAQKLPRTTSLTGSGFTRMTGSGYRTNNFFGTTHRHYGLWKCGMAISRLALPGDRHFSGWC